MNKNRIETRALVGCYVAYVGSCSPTLRDMLLISIMVLCIPLYIDFPEDGVLIAETFKRAQAFV